MKDKQLTIYTIGYQGHKKNSYIDLLTKNNISTIIDVREKAWSWNPVFKKIAFSVALNSANILYLHIPFAGNPSSNRKLSVSVKEILENYSRHLEKNPQIVTELLGFIDELVRDGQRVCLTCQEKDYESCHRSILIEHMLKIRPNIKVIHL